VIECFLLGDPVLVVDLAVAALVGNPVGRERRLEPLPRDVEQSFILWKDHAEHIDGILLDLLFCGLVGGVELFDEGLGIFLFVLVLVDLVGFAGELGVGVKFLPKHLF